jgi:cytochrome P450
MRGKDIKAGDNLMLLFPSANRDEEAFEQANAFRVDRKPNRHVGFGFGVHMCLGQALAKFEMRILFRELLARVGDFELNGEPRWVETAFIGGVKQLPVRVTFKRAAAQSSSVQG